MSTIAQLVHDSEQRLGNRVNAYVPHGAGFEAVTASETARRRRQLSAALLARGVQRGDRVAIISETRLEWTIVDTAVLSIGAVTVGVYPTSTPDQMRYVLEHAKVSAVFVGGVGPRTAFEKIRAAFADLKVVGDLDDLASLTADVDDNALAERRNAVAPDDLAALVYTSGTTGHPKGVRLTHRALYTASGTGIAAFNITASDVGVGFLPLAHVLARVNFYGTLHAGSTTWFSRSLEEVADVWRTAHPTVLALVPRVLEKIRARILAAVAEAPLRRQKLFARALAVGVERVRLIEKNASIPRRLAVEHALWERLIYRRVRAGLGWDRLRFALSGGAPLSRDVAEFFHALGVLILEGYGLSETSAATIVSLPASWRIGSVGKPLPGVELRLADDGEILLRSPGLFSGYEGDEAATRDAFDDSGFFRTGDVGALDGDGFLRITDRKKDIIVTAGGKNVAPQNVETALMADPRVLQAVVLGDGKPYLVALLVIDPSADREKAALEAVKSANEKLARFEQIKKFAVLDKELTIESGMLTPTQKIRRRVVMTHHAALVESLYAEERVTA